jgi:hypothetical protein
MSTEQEVSTSLKKDAFTSVAVWQLMTFLALIIFIWANEYLDYTKAAFGGESSPFNFFRACLISAAIIVAAIVCIGHTYERQRDVIRKLLKACPYCHRVKTHDGGWVHVADYFMENFPVDVSRGACDECRDMMASVEEKVQN